MGVGGGRRRAKGSVWDRGGGGGGGGPAELLAPVGHSDGGVAVEQHAGQDHRRQHRLRLRQQHRAHLPPPRPSLAHQRSRCAACRGGEHQEEVDNGWGNGEERHGEQRLQTARSSLHNLRKGACHAP